MAPERVNDPGVPLLSRRIDSVPGSANSQRFSLAASAVSILPPLEHMQSLTIYKLHKVLHGIFHKISPSSICEVMTQVIPPLILATERTEVRQLVITALRQFDLRENLNITSPRRIWCTQHHGAEITSLFIYLLQDTSNSARYGFLFAIRRGQSHAAIRNQSNAYSR